MFRRINKLYFLFPLLVIPTLALSMLAPLSKANALAGSDFNPGHIIDDAIFTNSNSMSVSDIQNFLNSKVPTCDTNGSQSKSYYYDLTTGEINVSSTGTWVTTSRALYGQRYADFWNYHTSDSVGDTRSSSYLINESVAPYVCLQNYVENPSSLQNNLQNPGASISGGESAAQIIYNAAQQYQINPQVLLTTLQKEQGIVTDDWPWMNEYRIAMGYACPDGAPCDSQYYGFANQVNSAAAQFRRYFTNPNHYNFVVGNDYIPYNPDANCGGSTVNIQNQATADLYDYTPFQPNAGALASVSNTSPGGTSNCGAYGNRNFWWYFNTWFGSSLGVPYLATYSSESVAPTVKQGQKTTITLRYQNMGTAPWYDSGTASGAGQPPVVLATMNPVNRSSSFVDTSWYSTDRPTGLFSKVYNPDGTLAANQDIATSGDTVEYDITLNVPSDYPPGTYNEYFSPIREGTPNWYMGADDVFMPITVQRAYSASYVSQSTYPTVHQNDSSNVYVRFQNTSTYAWYDTTTATANNQFAVALATDGPVNRGSAFSAGWQSVSRPTNGFSKVYSSDGVTLAADQHVAQPGQIVEYDFPLTATIATLPGVYQEHFSLVREGARDWGINNATFYYNVTVLPSTISASYSSQSIYPTIAKNGTAIIFERFVNSGNVAWYDSTSAPSGVLPIHLATSSPINQISPFFSSGSWVSANRPLDSFSKVYSSDGVTLAADQHVAQPGQIVEYDFPLTASTNTGVYKEYYQPIVETGPGNSWDIGGLVWMQVTVTN